MKTEKTILILGASFRNKGAQAMLFSTVSEFTKIFPGSRFYFSTDTKYDDKNYRFYPVNTHYEKKHHISVRDYISKLIRHKDNNNAYPEIKKIMNEVDLVLDVSGYALGSDWPEWKNRYYLDMIDFVRSYGKPIYLMPQSFGPFDREEADKLKKRIEKTLGYPKIVFARETEGKDLLEKDFALTNVLYSPDLVLQTKNIDMEAVFKEKPDINVPQITTKNNVCIIPNMQTVKRGNEEDILSLYRGIVNRLSDRGFNIYCINHSKEDLEIAEKINSDKVTMIEDDLSCIEYSEFIRQFQFIVASRYHSAVHAYKEMVPCIILGWAVKYRELAKLFEQDKYVFSISGNDINKEEILKSIDTIAENADDERRKIENNLIRIRKESCFDVIRDMENVSI